MKALFLCGPASLISYLTILTHDVNKCEVQHFKEVCLCFNTDQICEPKKGRPFPLVAGSKLCHSIAAQASRMRTAA